LVTQGRRAPTSTEADAEEAEEDSADQDLEEEFEEDLTVADSEVSEETEK
jgi:hypothetical protein